MYFDREIFTGLPMCVHMAQIDRDTQWALWSRKLPFFNYGRKIQQKSAGQRRGVLCCDKCDMLHCVVFCCVVLCSTAQNFMRHVLHCIRVGTFVAFDCAVVYRTAESVLFTLIRRKSSFTTIHHHHRVVYLKTGPQPLPKQVLHRVPYSASSFSFQYLSSKVIQ
jgi:hypothetical protein